MGAAGRESSARRRSRRTVEQTAALAALAPKAWSLIVRLMVAVRRGQVPKVEARR